MELLTILAQAGEATKDAAEEADKSDTPFYLVGGLLAAFAVAVAAIGITRPDLPEGPSRAIMVVGAILVVAAMVTSIAVS